MTDDEEYVLALQTRRELLDDKTSKAFAILTGLALKMAVARMLDGREWVERELAIMRQNGHTLLFGYQREEDYLRDALGLDLTFTSGGEDVC